MAVNTNRLGEDAQRVLTDILSKTNEIDTIPGVDSIYYRAQHPKDRPILDALQTDGLIEQKDYQRYLLTLKGLSALQEGKAEAIMAICEQIFYALRELYRRDAKKPAPVSELATGLGLSTTDVIKALIYLRHARLWGGYSNDLSDPKAFVHAAESILDYDDFDAVIGDLWRLNRQTANPLIYANPETEKVLEPTNGITATSSTNNRGVFVIANALSDTPASIDQDTLGYRAYSTAIVDFLSNKNTKAPFSLAITGSWGTGKTTLLRWIKDGLEKLNYKTVWFSPWKHNLHEEVWASFARTIIESLVTSPTDKVKLRWRRLKDTVPNSRTRRFVLWSAVVIILVVAASSLMGGSRFLFGMVAVLAPAAPYVASLWKAFMKSPLLKMLGSTKGPDYDEVLGFKKEFEEDLSRLIEIATSNTSGKPLIIFVDDLDRAPPPVPVKLLEAMNILIGQERCIFVIGLDLHIVGASIEAKYLPVIERLSLSRTGFSGENFIEKLVQLEFALPVLTENQVDQLLDSLLAPISKSTGPISAGTNDVVQLETREAKEKPLLVRPKTMAETSEIVFDEDSREFTSSIYFFSRCIPRNPRKIKRFINQYRLLAYVAARRGLFERNRVDLDGLGATIALAAAYPEIYRLINGYDVARKLRTISKWLGVDIQDEEVDDRTIEEYGLTPRKEKYRDARVLLPILINRADKIHDYLSLSAVIEPEKVSATEAYEFDGLRVGKSAQD